MISRVADHCFWYGRYLERAESTARVLMVTLNLALDGELTPRQCWLPGIIVSGEEEAFVARFGAAGCSDGETVQQYMTWDEENFACIRRSVGAARENARSIREVLSLEAWEATNELHLWLFSDEAQAQFREHRYGFYKHVRQSMQLCLGLLRSTMLHEAPLDFIWLGVLLERVGQTARTLDVQYHALSQIEHSNPIIETALWLSLLRACSGFEPFMKRNHSRVTGERVAGFLMLEPRFPRSVRYCLKAAFERLCDIRPPEDDKAPGGRSLARLRELEEFVALLDPRDLSSVSMHRALTRVVDETAEICNELGRELLGQGAESAVVVAAAIEPAATAAGG